MGGFNPPAPPKGFGNNKNPQEEDEVDAVDAKQPNTDYFPGYAGSSGVGRIANYMPNIQRGAYSDLGRPQSKPGTNANDFDGSLNVPEEHGDPGDAGSGFINLSHLLNLNAASGRQSAKDLAKRTRDAGQGATNALGGFEGDFNKAVKAGTVDAADYTNPYNQPGGQSFDRGDYAQNAIDKAKAGYTGPTDMTEQSGYADLAKKISAAGDMAKNASGGGYGVAAQIGKDTGLSATQSNAGAFYAGVNNKSIRSAGDQFKTLGASLDAANQRAMNYAQLGKRTTEGSVKTLGDYESNRQSYYKDLDDKRTREIDAQNAELEQRRRDEANTTKKQTEVKEHRSPELENTPDQAVELIRRGMPGHMAHNGVDWDEWEAAGRPDEDSEWYRQWQVNHAKIEDTKDEK